MNVLEVIQRSTEFLARRGVNSARLQVELLAAHVLGLPRLQLYLNFERRLTETELEQLRALVQRRSRHEPLQYLVGSTHFCGLEIEVNPDVLIPRPETELLAEAGWRFLNGLSSRAEGLQALDFGTGSGCVAMALAVHAPALRTVVGVDASLRALRVAGRNAKRHRLCSRLHWVAGNGLEALQPNRQFDLLISNPPYIPAPEVNSLAPEVRDFEPRAALEGGEDGLFYFRLLAGCGAGFLRPEGRLMAEFGDGQEQALPDLFSRKGWIIEKVEPDYSGRPRMLMARPGAT